MKEVGLGHLFGPFTESEMTEFFGTDRWLYNPRFILYQGEERKVRAIDDCLKFLIFINFPIFFPILEFPEAKEFRTITKNPEL